MLWLVGHMAAGPPSPKSTKALGTPPHPHLLSDPPSGQPLWQWVRPRQTLPASPPCSGHQLYLPQRGNALAPQPGILCPLCFSGASPIRATLSLALSSRTSDRPRQIAALWERLDAALFMPSSSPPFPPSRAQVPTTPQSACFSPHLGRGGDRPLSVF